MKQYALLMLVQVEGPPALIEYGAICSTFSGRVGPALFSKQDAKNFASVLENIFNNKVVIENVKTGKRLERPVSGWSAKSVLVTN